LPGRFVNQINRLYTHQWYPFQLYFGTLFNRYIQKLFARLKMAKGDGSYSKEMSKIEKQDVLLLDDFGFSRLDHYQREALMEIMEDPRTTLDHCSLSAPCQ